MDPVDEDMDKDNLYDGYEINVYNTDPLSSDPDGDDLSDYDEVITYGTDPWVADSDDDGLNDGLEVNSYGTDPLNSDTDNDSFCDGDEIEKGTNPLMWDKAEPIGYWSLDEGTGSMSYDESGFGHDGVLNNNPIWTYGRKGWGLHFDGVDDEVVIDGLNVTTAVGEQNTVVFWMYWNGIENTMPFWMG